MNEPAQPGLFIGIDWADQKHDCYVIDRDGKGFHRELKQSPEDIDAWVGEMLTLADGKPIAIMLEQSRGPLVHALMFRDNVLLYRRSNGCSAWLRNRLSKWLMSCLQVSIEPGERVVLHVDAKHVWAVVEPT